MIKSSHVWVERARFVSMYSLLFMIIMNLGYLADVSWCSPSVKCFIHS